jgi:hypothetical protein
VAGTCAGELPSGDRLVIGLNPPFGRNGQLANQVWACFCSISGTVLLARSVYS